MFYERVTGLKLELAGDFADAYVTVSPRNLLPGPKIEYITAGIFSPGLTALSGRTKSASSASETSSSMILNAPFACVSAKAMRNW